MNVARVTKGRALESGNIPAGAFQWATIYQFDEKESGRIKCCWLDGTDIYTGSQADGVKRWDLTTGG